MAGNAEGARKAAQTTKERHGQDFHARAGKKSWDNPDRSREVGFALMDTETHKQLSAKGGKHKKNEKEETSINSEAQEERTGVSE